VTQVPVEESKKEGRIIHVGIVHVGACYIKAHLTGHEYYWDWDVSS
jgi:hypothetical protein